MESCRRDYMLTCWTFTLVWGNVIIDITCRKAWDQCASIAESANANGPIGRISYVSHFHVDMVKGNGDWYVNDDID